MGLFSALKTDKSKFKLMGEEGCVATAAVEIPLQEAEEATAAAFSRLQSAARVPGFRAGKAPLNLIRQHFSSRAREEALDSLIRKHIPSAITGLKLNIVDTPVVTDVQWAEGKPVSLQFRVEIAPAPTAKDYLKIQVQRKPRVADDAAVSARVDELRQAHARLEVSKDETVSKSHVVVIDYTASREGKPLSNAKGSNELVDMSAEQTLPGLVTGLAGMKRNETKVIQVQIDGKSTDLSCTVTEIKSKILPPLDDEFAKDLGVQSISELNTKLKEVLDRELTTASESDVVRQIEEALVKNNRFPLPPSLVARQLESMMERMRRQLRGGANLPEKVLADLKANLQPKAEDEVRLAYVMSSIADKEKITVSEAEIATELEAGMRHADTDEKKAELKKAFEHRKDQISLMIRERKTLNFLKEHAVYKDA